jgi:phage baseplate assembly protein V
MNLQRAVKKIMAPLERRVRLMVTRGILRVAQNTPGIQTLQIQLGLTEVADRVEYFQHYGFTSGPLPSAEVIALFVGGSRAHGVVMGSRDRKFGVHPIASGEVLIWDHKGQTVWLKEDGIYVVSPTKVDVAAPIVNIATDALTVNVEGAATVNVTGKTTLVSEGDLEITAPKTTLIGELRVTGDVVAGLAPAACVSLLGHIHPTPAGPSSPPTVGVCPA